MIITGGTKYCLAEEVLDLNILETSYFTHVPQLSSVRNKVHDTYHLFKVF